MADPEFLSRAPQRRSYNVYAVSFRQGAGEPDHVVLAFVNPADPAQDRGRCYHVVGNARTGWMLEMREDLRFEANASFAGKEFFSRVPADDTTIDRCARRIPPLRASDDPPRDSATWVQIFKNELTVHFGRSYHWR
ncbi:MAG: hypothetical protein M1832_003365 [Thelocarpon impressellum]|nr:MAG: hypothetical protein M1832_003365 [Thelocarpon impressellum]